MEENEKNDVNLLLHDETGALLMLDKNERKLLKELLNMTLKSSNAREWITKKLGKEYIEVGENLLKTMGK